MKKLNLIFAIISAFAIASCDNISPDPVKVEFNESEKETLTDVARESFEIYSEFLSNNESESVIISPVGIYLTAAMLQNCNSDNPSVFASANQLNKKIIDNLNYPRENAVFSVNNNSVFNTLYEEETALNAVLDDYYYAPTHNFDFSNSEKVTDYLLNWINTTLSDYQLKNLPFYIDENYRRIVCNIVEFKGGWENPFSTSGTETRDFTSVNGETRKVSMMHNTGTFGVYTSDDITAVKLPYGSGEFAMTAIMTSDGSITYDDWTTVQNEMTYEDVRHLYFPKFEIETNTNLDVTTLNLDAEKYLLHQDAYIDVDEKGTYAAAVTTGVLTAPGPPVLELNFNKTFHFFIAEEATGTIVFAGRLY